MISVQFASPCCRTRRLQQVASGRVCPPAAGEHGCRGGTGKDATLGKDLPAGGLKFRLNPLAKPAGPQVLLSAFLCPPHLLSPQPEPDAGKGSGACDRGRESSLGHGRTRTGSEHRSAHSRSQALHSTPPPAPSPPPGRGGGGVEESSCFG